MRRRLRIVSVCRTLPNPSDPSGGVFVLNRLQGMAVQADVQVVQPIPFCPVLKPLPGWARSPSRRAGSLRVAHAPMFYVPRLSQSSNAMWLARSIEDIVGRLHREAPLDAIDAHFGYPEGAGCLRIARRLGIPLFVTVRGFENELVQTRGMGPQLLEAMRAAAGCINVSHSLKELSLRHGVKPDRARVIHNAIDSGTFHFGSKEAARSALSLEPQRPLIVSVGHLVARKRHHILIEAFVQLSRSVPDALLVIVGATSFERDYPDELARLARERGVADRVRFIGNIPPAEVVTWLQAADVFALATAREGCCNAVLEALAVGVPVVTTAAGDNAYFVKAGVNGYIVGVDETDSLANALHQTLSRKWDRPTIATQLAAFVGSWRDVGTRVIDFMEERLTAGEALASAS